MKRLFTGTMMWLRCLAVGIVVLVTVSHASTTVNIGLKHEYGVIGDTARVPVYLANYSSHSFDSTTFTLAYDTTVLRFSSASAGNGIVYDWTLSALEALHGIIKVRLKKGSGTAQLVYGDGELITCKFYVKGGVQSLVTPQSGMLYDQGTIVVPTLVQGRVTVGVPLVIPGDVNGTKFVDKADADSVLRYVAGWFTATSYPAFTSKTADVSGDAFISSFDAALISRHSVGLLQGLPIAVTDTFGSSKTLVSMVLSEPVQKTTNVYDYTLRATNVKGLVSAELDIICDYTIVNASIVSTSIKGARLSSKFNTSSRTLSVAAITNDIVDSNSVSLFVIRVQYQSGNSSEGLTFDRCLVNEGRMRLNTISVPFPPNYYVPLSSPAIKGALKAYASTMVMKNQVLRISKKIQISKTTIFIQAPAQILIYNLNGVLIKQKFIANISQPFSIKELPAGNYIARVIAENWKISQRFYKEP